jgi:hypothetical protein
MDEFPKPPPGVAVSRRPAPTATGPTVHPRTMEILQEIRRRERTGSLHTYRHDPYARPEVEMWGSALPPIR